MEKDNKTIPIFFAVDDRYTPFLAVTLKSLIEKMEKHYNVKFNFDETFLDFPKFLECGKYSDLTFNN